MFKLKWKATISLLLVIAVVFPTFQTQANEVEHEHLLIVGNKVIEVKQGLGDLSSTTIQIPEGVEIIGANAFRDVQIGGVQFPSTLREIEEYAFYNSGLSQLDLAGVETINAHAFQRNSLTALPSNMNAITTVGEYAFAENQITEVDFANIPNIVNVADSMFRANKITTIQFAQIKQIGANAFTDNELTGELTLTNVDTVSEAAFQGNNIVSARISNTTRIDRNAFLNNGRYIAIFGDDLDNLTGENADDGWGFVINPISIVLKNYEIMSNGIKRALSPSTVIIGDDLSVRNVIFYIGKSTIYKPRELAGYVFLGDSYEENGEQKNRDYITITPDKAGYEVELIYKKVENAIQNGITGPEIVHKSLSVGNQLTRDDLIQLVTITGINAEEVVVEPSTVDLGVSGRTTVDFKHGSYFFSLVIAVGEDPCAGTYPDGFPICGFSFTDVEIDGISGYKISLTSKGIDYLKAKIAEKENLITPIVVNELSLWVTGAWNPSHKNLSHYRRGYDASFVDLVIPDEKDGKRIIEIDFNGGNIAPRLYPNGDEIIKNAVGVRLIRSDKIKKERVHNIRLKQVLIDNPENTDKINIVNSDYNRGNIIKLMGGFAYKKNNRISIFSDFEMTWMSLPRSLSFKTIYTKATQFAESTGAIDMNAFSERLNNHNNPADPEQFSLIPNMGELYFAFLYGYLRETDTEYYVRNEYMTLPRLDIYIFNNPISGMQMMDRNLTYDEFLPSFYIISNIKNDLNKYKVGLYSVGVIETLGAPVQASYGHGNVYYTVYGKRAFDIIRENFNINPVRVVFDKNQYLAIDEFVECDTNNMRCTLRDDKYTIIETEQGIRVVESGEGNPLFPVYIKNKEPKEYYNSIYGKDNRFYQKISYDASVKKIDMIWPNFINGIDTVNIYTEGDKDLTIKMYDPKKYTTFFELPKMILQNIVNNVRLGLFQNIDIEGNFGKFYIPHIIRRKLPNGLSTVNIRGNVRELHIKNEGVPKYIKINGNLDRIKSSYSDSFSGFCPPPYNTGSFIQDNANLVGTIIQATSLAESITRKVSMSGNIYTQTHINSCLFSNVIFPYVVNPKFVTVISKDRSSGQKLAEQTYNFAESQTHSIPTIFGYKNQSITEITESTPVDEEVGDKQIIYVYYDKMSQAEIEATFKYNFVATSKIDNQLVETGTNVFNVDLAVKPTEQTLNNGKIELAFPVEVDIASVTIPHSPVINRIEQAIGENKVIVHLKPVNTGARIGFDVAYKTKAMITSNSTQHTIKAQLIENTAVVNQSFVSMISSYENPRLYLSGKGLHNAALTEEFYPTNTTHKVTLDLSGVKRATSKYKVSVELPEYTSKNGKVRAVFPQELNKQWKLNQLENTVEYEVVSASIEDFSNLELTLQYPEIKRSTNFEIKARYLGTTADTNPLTAETSKIISVTGYVSPKPGEVIVKTVYGERWKRVNSDNLVFFYDTRKERAKEQEWSIELFNRGENPTRLKMIDELLDNRLIFSRVKPDRSLIGGKIVLLDENNLQLAQFTINGDEVSIPTQMAERTRKIAFESVKEYRKNTSITAKLYTKLRNPNVNILLPTENSTQFENKVVGFYEEEQRAEVTNRVYAEKLVQSIQASLTNSGESIRTHKYGDEITYYVGTLGVAEDSLENLTYYLQIPDGVEIEDVQFSSGLKSVKNKSWRLNPNNRKEIIVEIPNVDFNNVQRAFSVRGRIRTAKAGNHKAKLYMKEASASIRKENLREREGERLSYSESTLTTIGFYAIVPEKEIKKEADVLYEKTLKTTIGEVVTYRLSLANYTNENKSNIQILDILPFDKDEYMTKDGNSGIRKKRNSEFQYTVQEVRANNATVTYINGDTSLFRINNNKTIEQWLADLPQQAKTTQPTSETKAILFTLNGNITADGVWQAEIDVVTPNNVSFIGKRAYNTFAYKYGNNPFIESEKTTHIVTGPQSTITLKKVDHEQNPLSDAVFSLYTTNGVLIESKRTGSDGLITFNVVADDYMLVETVTPKGYYPTRDRRITIQDFVDEGYNVDLGNIVNWKKASPLVPLTGDFILYKTGPDKRPLKDVVFSLVHKTATDTKCTIITDENGLAILRGIPAGTYTLKETSTLGILKNAPTQEIKIKGGIEGVAQTQVPIVVESEYVRPASLPTVISENSLFKHIKNEEIEIIISKIGVKPERYKANQANEEHLSYRSTDGEKIKFQNFDITLEEENGTQATYTTSSDGYNRTFSGLKLNTDYYLKETSLAGYSTLTQGEIILWIDNTFRMRVYHQGMDRVNSFVYQGNSLIVANKKLPEPSTLKIRKRDGNGNALSDVEFTIENLASGVKTVVTTGPNGEAVFQVPNEGSGDVTMRYKIVETKGKAGYLFSPKYEVQRNYNNLKGKEDVVLFDNPRVNFTLKKIEIYKTGLTEKAANGILRTLSGYTKEQTKDGTYRIVKPLAGANLVVKDKKTNTIVKQEVTPSNGEIAVPDIDTNNNDLVIYETVAPIGYALDSTEYRVDWGLYYNRYKNSRTANIVVEIPNRKLYGSILIHKLDKHTGRAIQNTEFTLTDLVTGVKKRLLTDTSGIVIFDNLELRSYQVEETRAATGYAIGDTNETITLTESDREKRLLVHNTQLPKTIVLTKQNEKGQAMTGVEFTLTSSDGQFNQTVRTNHNGQAEISNLIPKLYVLKEIKTLEGYHLIKDSLKIDLRTATEQRVTKIVVNAKEIRELPDTGTSGTLPYVVIGFVSLFTATFKRKKDE